MTEFRPGDDVFALLEQGGFAEYVSVPERLLARKPGNLSYEQAAAVPMAATTALLGLRDVARIEPGQKVLVNGASGGVGTFAVQIARALGARADAVCSLPNADLARSIGANDVIDYTSQDFTRSGHATTCCWTSREAARSSPAGGYWHRGERWSSSAGRPGDGYSPPDTCSRRSRWHRWCRNG